MAINTTKILQCSMDVIAGLSILNTGILNMMAHKFLLNGLAGCTIR